MPVNGSSNHRDHSICIHLSAVEFRDALAIHYERPLMRKPATSICDGCGAPYSLVHAIDCKKGGLVTQRYNEVRDALGDFSALAYKEVTREPIVRRQGRTQSL